MKYHKILLAGAAFGFAMPAMAETWDMPVAYPGSNYLTQTAVDFGKCVTEGTGGDITIAVHPNGSLYSGADIKRAIQTGQVPIGERLLSAHENENPLFGVDALPFVASSFEASEKLYQATKGPLGELLETQNLVLVYSALWGPQGLYAKKDINSAEDLKGVKFRAYNTATGRLSDLAGMVAVQIEAAELSQALSTGVAESFISSGTTGVDSKVWESLTHFYDVQAWLPRNSVMVNKTIFDKLPAEHQDTIMTCGQAAEKSASDTAQELTAQLLQELSDNGMTVSAPSPQLAADLEGYGEILVNEWLERAGEPGKKVIDAYRGTAE